VGIQFTMNNSVSKQEQKNKQIERAKKFGDADVDDIILVTMPFAKIRDTFNRPTWTRLLDE